MSPEPLFLTVDADSSALAEIRALAEEYRQIVADLRELRGKPGVHEQLAELGKQAHTTTADIAMLREHVITTTEPEYLRNRWQPAEVATYVSVMNIAVLRLRDALKSSWLVDERAPDSEIAELAQTLAKIVTTSWREPISDPHGALDRWRALETDPAPMDGSTVLLAAFTEVGALVWACAASWVKETMGDRCGWFALLPEGYSWIGGEYPPTHWRPI